MFLKYIIIFQYKIKLYFLFHVSFLKVIYILRQIRVTTIFKENIMDHTKQVSLRHLLN